MRLCIHMVMSPSHICCYWLLMQAGVFFYSYGIFSHHIGYSTFPAPISAMPITTSNIVTLRMTAPISATPMRTSNIVTSRLTSAAFAAPTSPGKLSSACEKKTYEIEVYTTIVCSKKFQQQLQDAER